MPTAAAVIMQPEDWTEYVRRITKGVPRERVAEAAGIHVTGLYRWLRSSNPPRAENVVSFARACGQPPAEALVHAGYLNREEAAAVIEIHQSKRALSDDDLIDELTRRLRDRGGDGQVAPVQDIATRLGGGLAAPDDSGECL